MSGNLGDFEGRLVGSWKLDSLLGVRGGKAFYLTSAKKNSEDNALLLQLVSKRDEPEALASWNRARKLTDCPLLHVHATGEAVLDGQPVAFAVLDLPDDDLSEVLAKRTLDATEAKSTFLAVAAGLDSLHQRGIMHGAVVPSNIFIVKDEMRLSVDNIAPAGQRGIASDIKQFGETLVQALTGTTGDAALATLEAPFSEIAAGCLSGDWTASQVVWTLSGQERNPRRATAPLYVEPPASPDPKPTKPDPRAARARAKSEARQGFAAWLSGPQWTIMGTGILVGLVLLIYLFVHGPRPRHVEITQTPVAAAANPVPTPVPVVQEPPKPTRVRSGRWAVIAATYYTFKDAQKRANRLRKESPGLHPHVFPPDGQGTHYFIVLGSGLSQDAAQRLLRTVREQGAPSDCYVTKLDET
jgi:hypothetical protein